MGIGHTTEPDPPGRRIGPSAAPGRPRRRRLTPVARVEDERAYLYEIIRTIGSGPDLDTILTGVVRLVTEATGCHACLIWFREEQSLILRASSSPYAHLAGVIEMGLGEGLAGWVAKTRRSAFIEENALEDPRVKYFPELDEEDFQSLVSVPMFGRDADVMGVISLHAEAPHEFHRDDLDFLEHTASLMAGAVENARSYEDSTARVALLTNLSRLSQQVAAADATDDLLAAVSSGTRDLLGASRCEIFLADEQERLNLAAASPPRVDVAALEPRSVWLRGDDPDPQALRELAEGLWGKDPGGTPMLVPLRAGDGRLGLLAILATHPQPGAEMALTAVAAQASVAIRRLELVERLLERNLVKDFFVALSGRDASPDLVATLAGRLGCDLDAPHALVRIAQWTGVSEPPARAGPRTDRIDPTPWSDIAGRVELRLVERFPRALVDRVDTSIRALMPIPAGDLDPVVKELRAMMGGAGPELGPLSVGISTVCRGPDSYPRASDEVIAAAEVGGLLWAGPGVTTFEELGPYRYVLGSADGVRDRDQQRLERLVAYDRRRGAQLLDTLERFLDERGNVVRAARALYIHPNTLRQRLERIEGESGIDLEHDDWLSLAVAVKVVKLRVMRASLGGERGNDG